MAIISVAPFAGAWIEIIRAATPNRWSGFVAPFAGAWIEITLKWGFELIVTQSHPSRVRGLKFDSKERYAETAQSHPSRVRGLKFLKPNYYYYYSDGVAPFAGAWIEI